MISTKILIQRVKSMDRKKLVTYSILGSIVLLLVIIMGFSMLLRGDSTYSPLVTTKLRAALLTYKRTVVITGATPTPVGAGGFPTLIPTVPSGKQITPASSGPSANPSQQQVAATTVPVTDEPSPTDTVIFDENNPDETGAPEAATDTPTEEISEEVSPTQATTLPETGSIQYPIILFISASVFLFISFLF